MLFGKMMQVVTDQIFGEVSNTTGFHRKKKGKKHPT